MAGLWPFFRSIWPPSFGDANVTTQPNQSDRRDRRRQSKDKPHCSGVPRTVFGTKRSQQPSACSDQDLANEEWKVRQRAVRSFLPFRCNCCGILIDSRRVERFSNREYSQI